MLCSEQYGQCFDQWSPGASGLDLPVVSLSTRISWAPSAVQTSAQVFGELPCSACDIAGASEVIRIAKHAIQEMNLDARPPLRMVAF